ncbi:MAG: translocation/assembly module TamB [Paludibacteraceae bacterium]|nr:translocation/assembly module TamB [Paludibacteraceae bacterium]
MNMLKKLTQILFSIAGVLMLALLLAYTAFQNERIQRRVVSVLTESLSKQVGSEIGIDHVDWKFPNSFVLQDVYVKDLHNDTLLSWNRAKVTINMMKLFSSTISFRTIQFSGMKANLSVDSMNVPNFQFFVDAFKPKEEDTLSLQWSMDIESVAFNHCDVSFRNPNKSELLGRLDPNDLYVSDLCGRMFVSAFSEDSMHIWIDDISMSEKSGLVVDTISATVDMNRERIYVKNLVLAAPHSHLRFDQIMAYHDNYEAFKDPVNKLRGVVNIAPSHLHPADFSAIHPSLDILFDDIRISGAIVGSPNDLHLNGLDLSYGESTKFQGAASVKDLFPHPKNFIVDAHVAKLSSSPLELSDLLYVVIDREVLLPKTLDSLGTVNFSGEANGSLQDLLAQGVLSSVAGDMAISANFKSTDSKLNSYHAVGEVSANSYHLARIFGADSELGDVSMKLNVGLDKLSDRNYVVHAEGKVDSFSYKNYCYENIRLNGKFDGDGFDGELIMSDKNAEVNFSGKADFKKHDMPVYHFSSHVDKLNLSATNLLTKYDNTSISFDIESNFVGNSIDNIEGSFSMDNVVFVNDDRELNISNLSVAATVDQRRHQRKLTIFSDYINGDIVGQYQFSTLGRFFHNLAHQYVPSLVKEELPMPEKKRTNDFTFNFVVDNTEPINDAYELPISILEETRLTGFVNDSTNRFRLRVESDQLQYNDKILTDMMMLVENPRDEMKTMLRTTCQPVSGRRNPYFFSINALTKNDSLNFKSHFSNAGDVTYSGSLQLGARFKDYTEGLGVVADFHILPSSVILNDVEWLLRDSHIELDRNKITIDSFYFNHDTQFLSVNGVNSTYSGDSINVHFSDFKLDYISNIIANKDISFNGVSDGDIFLFNMLGTPHFKGDLYVYDAAINNETIGDLSVHSRWLEKRKCVDFDAKLLSPYDDQLYRSDIKGGVFLGDDSLYIEGDLKNVDLKFLRHYLKSVIPNNTGTVSGNVKAYGKFGHIGLSGSPYVRNFAFDVDYLNTSFVLSDTVYLTPTTIRLNQTPVYDVENNHAILSGLLLHDGFRNFKFAFDMNFDKLLGLNTQEEDNENFFGKAYMKGSANISGTSDRININLDLTTRENTMLTIPVEGTSSTKECNFISFVEAEDNKTMAEKRRSRWDRLKKIREQSDKSPTELFVDAKLVATPDAQVQLIMDAQQGDLIRAYGAGNLHLTYNSRENDFKMHGSYEIEKGDYLFTIQSVISRKFDINSGSTVSWTGDPSNAFINIEAQYGLNASLTDIIEDPNLRSTPTPVRCLLDVTGTISQPFIKFDIDLPNSDDDVRSKLKSVINTEEAVNRNVASLLALGHFYTMDKSTLSSVTTTELSSVGFSTLSSQLSNWISKMSRDINIGLNYKPTTTSTDGTSASSEFDVALSTQLFNDRLLLNGNFGYRDDVEDAANISNSIIDFDLEYKLSKSGRFRTKAFNRSNNSYFKQAANTQGIGVVYHEDFDTFSGLMKSYWKAIKGVFRKDDEEKDKKEKDKDKKGKGKKAGD